MRIRRNLRRDVIKTLGAGAALAAMPGCTITSPNKGYQRPYSRKPWVAPRVSRSNVIREIVGHRPFRAKGFRVESEKFDDKTIVHNYGHGGSGITLSWGSSALAVRETLGMEKGRVAVVGSGVMGLTSARLLQDAGWEVTLYTRDMARHTVSNVAGGEWGPASAHDPDVSSDAFKSQLAFAGKIAHHAHTNLGGSDYGIRWMELYRMRRGPPDGEPELFDELYPYQKDLQPHEHPFPFQYVHHSLTMMIEPATFLRRLTEDVHQAGGKFVIRNFADKTDILSLDEALIFNCTGMGAATLFDDEDLVPARGQLVFLPPEPEVDYLTIGGGSDLLYMFSRSDALVLGGSYEIGNYSTQPDPAVTERILRENQHVFSGFGH